MTMESDQEAMSDRAVDLRLWFDSVRTSLADLIEAGSNTEQHRKAALWSFAQSRARELTTKQVDTHGELYAPLSLFLAAACSRLRIALLDQHWKAALEGVGGTIESIGKTGFSHLGLDLGTPAEFFKLNFDEAIFQAGLSDRPSILSPESRKLALGLAVNWGLRLLIAYALQVDEPSGKPDESKQDLSWLRRTVRSVLQN